MPLPTRTRLMLSCIRPCFGSSRLSRASLCLPFAVCLFPSLSSFTSIRGRDCGFWRLPFPVTSFLHGGSKPLIPVDSGERLRGDFVFLQMYNCHGVGGPTSIHFWFFQCKCKHQACIDWHMCDDRFRKHGRWGSPTGSEDEDIRTSSSNIVFEHRLSFSAPTLSLASTKGEAQELSH